MIDYRPLPRFAGTRKEYDRMIRTVCGECSVGCGMVAFLLGNRIVDVQGDLAHGISAGRLCARGIAFVQGVENPERLTAPQNRDSVQKSFEEISEWDKALDILADRLRRARERHGPECLAIGCHPEAGIDFAYGARRFAALWGTSLVFDERNTPDVSGLPGSLRSPGAPCTEWNQSRCIILVESDLASTHPVAWQLVAQAQDRGATVVAVDSRFTATMSKANVAIRIRPSTGNVLGMSLMGLLLDLGACQDSLMEEAFKDLAGWRASFSALDTAEAANVVGISVEDLRDLAALMESSNSATVITGRETAYQPGHGIWLTLATAMGWTAQAGGGWYPLDSGIPPLIADDDLESEKPTPLPWRSGTHAELARILITDACSGNRTPVRALITTGNCLNGFLKPLGDCTAEMDPIAHVGAFPNATAYRAHMLFPLTLWPERDGLHFSTDRAIQWGKAMISPPGGCGTGLDFWIGLAGRLGWDEFFPWRDGEDRSDQQAFSEWLLSSGPWTKGITAAHLQQACEGGRLVRWPFPEGRLMGSEPPIFPTPDGKIEPTPCTWPPEVREEKRAGFPLFSHCSVHDSGPSDSGEFLPWIAELHREGLIQINPLTAAALDIENGDEVVVRSAAAAVEGHAALSGEVPPWMVSSEHVWDDPWVLVHRKDQSCEAALAILEELLT